MALASPPRRAPGTPRTMVLPSGTLVYRVFHVRYGPNAFKQRMAPSASSSRPGGGRFDGTDLHPFPFLYAGSTPGVALAETLLRDAGFSDSGSRTLLQLAIAPLGCVPIEVQRELRLIDLRGGRALAAVGATAALVHCAERHYLVSRQWASRLREWCPLADGMVWRSRWEPDGDAYIFFGDRLEPADQALKALGRRFQRIFATPGGKNWLRNKLLEYHTDLR